MGEKDDELFLGNAQINKPVHFYFKEVRTMRPAGVVLVLGFGWDGVEGKGFPGNLNMLKIINGTSFQAANDFRNPNLYWTREGDSYRPLSLWW